MDYREKYLTKNNLRFFAAVLFAAVWMMAGCASANLYTIYSTKEITRFYIKILKLSDR